jgi:hypothetical protein
MSIKTMGMLWTILQPFLEPEWTEQQFDGLILKTSPSRIAVEQACRGAGLETPTDHKTLGCTDFTNRIIYSISDEKIIRHEMDHWNRWSAEHK